MTASSKKTSDAKPKLALVSDDIYHFNRQPETPAARIKRLQLEARVLAREQVEALERQMMALSVSARELSLGGEAYPPGIREMAARMAEDLEAKAQSMEAVMERIPLPTL